MRKINKILEKNTIKDDEIINDSSSSDSIDDKNNNYEDDINNNYNDDKNNNYKDDKDNNYEDDKTNIFNPNKFFKAKELRYYKMICKYYKKECSIDNINKMIDVINGNSIVSLRVLDWFVTKYCKRKIYIIEQNKNDENENNQEDFDIHISYKSELKSYKKKYFDPFRRQAKFYYYFDDDKKMKLYTTLGQLNFFKWAISKGIIDYVENNINQIINSMNITTKEDKKRKDKKKQNKTKEEFIKNINIKATKIIEDDEVKITVNFD